MSKNFSGILNVVLLIAVAVLYYLHFSNSSSVATTGISSDSTAIKPLVKAPKDIKTSKIVFVNTDVLNEKYEMVKELSSAIKAQQQTLDAKYK